jgi:hypothetical protein
LLERKWWGEFAETQPNGIGEEVGVGVLAFDQLAGWAACY